MAVDRQANVPASSRREHYPAIEVCDLHMASLANQSNEAGAAWWSQLVAARLGGRQAVVAVSEASGPEALASRQPSALVISRPP